MTALSIDLDKDPKELAKELEDLALAIRKKHGVLRLHEVERLENESLSAIKKKINPEFLDKAKATVKEISEVKSLEIEVKGKAEVEIYGIETYELENGELYQGDLVEIYDYSYDDSDVKENPEVKKLVEERKKKAEELIADVRKFAKENELDLGLVWQVVLE